MAIKEGDKVTTIACECWHVPSRKKLYLSSGHGEIVGEPFFDKELSFLSIVQVAWVSDTDTDETPTVAQLYFQLRDVRKVKVRRAVLLLRVTALEAELAQEKALRNKLQYRLERVENHLFGTNSFPSQEEPK